MSIRIKLSGLLLLVLLAGSGCKKWLDVNPKTNVVKDRLFETEQGFKDALTGVYTQLASRSLYAREFTMAFMDVLAQNYSVTSNFHVYNKASQYNYTDAVTRLKIDSIWLSGYKAIAGINNLLEAIDNKQDIFKGNNYKIIKGEALGLRALLHFDLLRTFGPVTSAGEGAKAIPYMTNFSMEVQASKTAGEVMDLCMKDLGDATELLSGNRSVVYGVEDPFLSYTRNHLNYWAATALKARISLWRGDKTNAYAYAQELIKVAVFPWVSQTDISVGTTNPSRTFPSEHIFAVYVSNLKEINAELFRAASGTTNVLTNSATFINNRFEIASGGTTDYRYAFLWKTDGTSSTKYPAKYLIDDLQYAGRGEWRVPVITLSEMYYIAAESATTTQESVSLLNEVRAHRGQAALPENLTADLIATEIFKEYKKEFYQQGQLFFYYKRLNKPNIEGYGLPVGQAIYVLPKPNDENEFNN